MGSDHLLRYMGVSIIVLVSYGSAHPHQPFKWSLIRWKDQFVIQQTTTAGAPSFRITLCDLVSVQPCFNQWGFYFCPSSNPGKGYCNYPNMYYCAYWGCETIAMDWTLRAGRNKFLQVGYGPQGCNQQAGPRYRWWGHGIGYTGTFRGNKEICKVLYINITNLDDTSWVLGKMWGVRFYKHRTDRGGLVLIKRRMLIGPRQ